MADAFVGVSFVKRVFREVGGYPFTAPPSMPLMKNRWKRI